MHATYLLTWDYCDQKYGYKYKGWPKQCPPAVEFCVIWKHLISGTKQIIDFRLVFPHCFSRGIIHDS